MKRKYILIISVMMSILLFIIGSSMMKEKEDITYKDETMSYNSLIIRVNEDSLYKYINMFYTVDQHPSLKISNKKKYFIIKYNKDDDIFLDIGANFMEEEKKKFNKIITDKDGEITLNLNKKSGYVDCPAPILAELLRKMYILSKDNQ